MDLEDRLAGTLLGTALGDALGLVVEGMSAHKISRKFGTIDHFRFFGRTGIVSDDTEQSALVAQTLIVSPRDVGDAVRSFRRSLLGWFLRLPWGLGLATLRACFRIALGFRESGVYSAGNGAAMRAAIVGVYFREDASSRRAFSTALARVTHTDPRAVQSALFVAELAALCSSSTPVDPRIDLVNKALSVVDEPSLREAILRAIAVESQSLSAIAASETLGNTGFVLHTLPLAVFMFLRSGESVLPCLSLTISAGGDTDSIAAIVGAWLGALHGERGLPESLVQSLQPGPFGLAHLRALAHELTACAEGRAASVPRYLWPLAMARNLALFPVALFHAFRTLLP